MVHEITLACFGLIGMLIWKDEAFKDDGSPWAVILFLLSGLIFVAGVIA